MKGSHSPALQTKLFIDGEFVDASGAGTIATLNPHDNMLIASVAQARAEDVDRAVEAAARAFPAWRDTAAADRGRLLIKLADLIESRAEELARIESIDTGHPIRDARALDVPRTAATFRYFGGLVDKLQGSVIPVETGFLNYLVREPLGVVGQIVPWNFPIMFTSWKMGPALAAGNCTVLKPAELTPLSSLKIAELAREVGFPKGVINIMPGYGRTAGQHLAEHPGVAKDRLYRVDRHRAADCAGIFWKLEAGPVGAWWKGRQYRLRRRQPRSRGQRQRFRNFHHQGQACIAGSRLLLQESIADDFTNRFLKLAASIRLGNPLDPEYRDGTTNFVGTSRASAELRQDRDPRRR